MKFKLVETLLPYNPPGSNKSSKPSSCRFIRICYNKGEFEIDTSEFCKVVDDIGGSNLLNYVKQLPLTQPLPGDMRVFMIDKESNEGYLWINSTEELWDIIPNQLVLRYLSMSDSKPLNTLYIIRRDGLQFAEVIQGNLDFNWIKRYSEE